MGSILSIYERVNYIPASTNKSVSYKLRYRYISFYAIYCCYLVYPFEKTTAPAHCFTQLNTHACQKERLYAKNNYFFFQVNKASLLGEEEKESVTNKLILKDSNTWHIPHKDGKLQLAYC